jgi:hypothetical protein
MGTQGELPGMAEEQTRVSGEPVQSAGGAVRVVRAVREQIVWEARSLEECVGADHPVRAIWALVERLDLAGFYGTIRAVVDGPGRPASAPFHKLVGVVG